jgi:hypothetical protein
MNHAAKQIVKMSQSGGYGDDDNISSLVDALLFVSKRR